MRYGFTVALLAACSAAALQGACKDGVTPDCTTDPTVCAPIEGDAAPATSAPDGAADAGDAGDGASDTTDAAADAADASG